MKSFRIANLDIQNGRIAARLCRLRSLSEQEIRPNEVTYIEISRDWLLGLNHDSINNKSPRLANPAERRPFPT